MRRDLLADVVKVAAIAAICVPLCPEPRVWWWCAMRACQNVSRRVGLLALAAEDRYHKEIG